MKKILTILTVLLFTSCGERLHKIARKAAGEVSPFQSEKHGMRTYGTGFNLLYKGKTYLITNAHVCRVSDRLGHSSYATVKGKRHRIIKYYLKHDLCALETDAETGLRLSEQVDAELLDQTILIGHPRGLPATIRMGHIVSLNERICFSFFQCFFAHQVSNIGYGGNSGSPVLNESGLVIGVLFAGDRRFHTEMYIVPLRFLKDFMKSL